MGVATITGGGPTGRYTIELDYGEATRAATVAAFQQQIANYDAAIATAQAALDAAEAAAAEQRAAIAAATQVYIDAGGTGNSSALAVQAAQIVLEQTRKQYVQAQKATVDARLRVASLTTARAQLLDMLQRWQSAVLVETKAVWCTDYTENGAGAVATIDINGETDLTLIAPGCRAWQPSDGLVSTARKAAAIAAIQSRLAALATAITRNQEAITAATAAETAARAALAAEQAAYIAAAPEQQNIVAQNVQRLAEEVQDAIRAVRTLQARRVVLLREQVDENTKLAQWQARPDTATPNAGDGVMTSTLIQAPHQSYLNRAILPGWQRHMPTYRWGTITALDKDADTASVSLADATSSAQGLPINQTGSLSNVPVVYMTCNAKAFEEGDRVVVQFLGQDWANPRVIGFLDNPKPCQLYQGVYLMIGNTTFSQGRLSSITTLERYRDEQWGPVAAPTPNSATKFLGWTDGVTTLVRDDGRATQSITRRAEYTYAPNFKCSLFVTYGGERSELIWADPEPYRNFTVYVTVNKRWSAEGFVGQPAFTPPETTQQYQVFYGRGSFTLGAEDAAEVVVGAIQDGRLWDFDGVPVRIPDVPGNTQTVTFKLSGSENVYSVTGSLTSDPFPVAGNGQQIPPGGGFGDYLYAATSWSAEFAE